MADRYMDRAGRELDICKFINSHYVRFGAMPTLGDYARHAHVSKSPHLRAIFFEMIDSAVLIVEQKPYRATIKYVFGLNYEYIKEFVPTLYREIAKHGFPESLGI